MKKKMLNILLTCQNYIKLNSGENKNAIEFSYSMNILSYK